MRTATTSRFLESIPFALALALVGLYSHFLRPIWFDEMQYFVLGGLESPLQVVAVVHETASNINQGQTGFYQLLVFGSLKILGSSLLALRLPSILFTLLFVATSLLYLRRKGVTWVWQTLFVILLSGAATLMLYASEARVYIALVGLTSSALLYYSYSPTSERTPIRLFGWLAVPLLGVVQPYAVFYLPIVILAGWLTREDRSQESSWRGLLRWSRPTKIMVAATVYAIAAYFTWIQGTANFSNDPTEWIDRPFAVELLHEHLMPVLTQPITFALWILVMFAALTFLFIRNPWRPLLARLSNPLVLLALALIGSLVISLLSLSQGYWILPRQWVASIGLALVALTWLLSVLAGDLGVLSRGLSRSFTLAVTAISVASVFSLATFQLGKWLDSIRNFPATQFVSYSQEDLRSRLDTDEYPTDKDWIRYSQSNAVSGGSVWPELAHFYSDRDWSDFEVVIDPNQLTIYD